MRGRPLANHRRQPALRLQVLQRVESAKRNANVHNDVRVVAVSKTKPLNMLQEAYDAGQRVFGENYVQELMEKAPQLPADIEWHFIGHLQSNKVKGLIDGVPNLAMMETVDSEKLASKLDGAVGATGRSALRVFVQVNTSGEESKYGVDPGQVVKLASHIVNNCHHLKLAGLMTIGMRDYSSTPANFSCLAECRKQVCQVLSLQEKDLELSMGMSGDFEAAIAMGSTNVRVGSTIFGARIYD